MGCIAISAMQLFTIFAHNEIKIIVINSSHSMEKRSKPKQVLNFVLMISNLCSSISQEVNILIYKIVYTLYEFEHLIAKLNKGKCFLRSLKLFYL